MKKFVSAIIISLIFFGAAAYAQAGDQEGQVSGKSDEKLLKETVLLSQKVKEFEKTLGIKPSEALSQSRALLKNRLLLWPGYGYRRPARLL